MRHGNEVESICDTAIRLFINSVTKTVADRNNGQHAMNWFPQQERDIERAANRRGQRAGHERAESHSKMF